MSNSGSGLPAVRQQHAVSGHTSQGDHRLPPIAPAGPSQPRYHRPGSGSGSRAIEPVVLPKIPAPVPSRATPPPTPPLEPLQRRALSRYEQELRDKFEIERLEKQLRAQEDRLSLRQQMMADRDKALRRAHEGELSRLQQQERQWAVRREEELAARKKQEQELQEEEERQRELELKARRRVEAEHLLQEEEARKRKQFEAERINREEADRRERRRQEDRERAEKLRPKIQGDRPSYGSSEVDRAREDAIATAEAVTLAAQQREQEEMRHLEDRLNEILRPTRTVAEIRSDRLRMGLAVGESYSPARTAPGRAASMEPPDSDHRALSAPSGEDPKQVSPPIAGRQIFDSPQPPKEPPQEPPQEPSAQSPQQPSPQQRSPARPVGAEWNGISTLERALSQLGTDVPAPLQTLFQLLPGTAESELSNLKRFLEENPSFSDYPSLHLLGSVLPPDNKLVPGDGISALRDAYSATVVPTRPGMRAAPGMGTLVLFDAGATEGLIPAPLKWLAAAEGNNRPLELTAALRAPIKRPQGAALKELTEVARAHPGGMHKYERLLQLEPGESSSAAAVSGPGGGTEKKVKADRGHLHYIADLASSFGLPMPGLRAISRLVRSGRGIEACVMAAGELLPYSRGLLTLVQANALPERTMRYGGRGEGYGLSALADASPDGGLNHTTAKTGVVALCAASAADRAPLLTALGDGGGGLVSIVTGRPYMPPPLEFPHLGMRNLENLFTASAGERKWLEQLHESCSKVEKVKSNWPFSLSEKSWPRREFPIKDRPFQFTKQWPHNLSHRLWSRGAMDEPHVFSVVAPQRIDPLSCWFPAPMRIDGVLWSTAEHYIQAQKFAGTPDEDEIRAAVSAERAAELGCQAHRPQNKDWEARQVAVMFRCQREKFQQHPSCARALLETGSRPIVFTSRLDAFWGSIDGRGLNMLGAVLSGVRRELHLRQRLCGGLMEDGSVLNDGLLRVKDPEDEVDDGRPGSGGPWAVDKFIVARIEREKEARAKVMPSRVLVLSGEYQHVAGAYERGRNVNLKPTWDRLGGGARIFSDERGYWCVCAAGPGGEAISVLESPDPCALRGVGPMGVDPWTGLDIRLERWDVCAARVVEQFLPGDKVEVRGSGTTILEGSSGVVLEQEERSGKVTVDFGHPNGILRCEPNHVRSCAPQKEDMEETPVPRSAAGTMGVVHGGLLGRNAVLNEGLMRPRREPEPVHGGVMPDGSVLVEGLIPPEEDEDEIPPQVDEEEPLDPIKPAVPLQQGSGGPLPALQVLQHVFSVEGKSTGPALSAAVRSGPGGSISKLMEAAGAAAMAPPVLLVKCDARPHVDGVYEIGEVTHNGMPTWCGKRSRIYVNDEGDWVIAAIAPGDSEMRSVLESADGHQQEPPQRVPEWLMYEPSQENWIGAKSASVCELLPPGACVVATGVRQLEGRRGMVIEQRPEVGETVVEYAEPIGMRTIPVSALISNTGLEALCSIAGVAWGREYGEQLASVLRREEVPNS
eukprot:Hpha_TRINITY_DN23093_c0_g1::TRINITY_DN23093_c0_g1_i1::g.109346::m.109346